MRAELIEHRTVVRVSPRSRRPIYGTRYLAKCPCGFTTGGDYIDTVRRFRAHRQAAGCVG